MDYLTLSDSIWVGLDGYLDVVGRLTADSGAKVEGTGTVRINTALEVIGPYTTLDISPALIFDGNANNRVVQGPGSVRTLGSVTFKKNTTFDGANVTFDQGALFEGGMTVLGATAVLKGNATWKAGDLGLGSAAYLRNEGTLDIQTGGTVTHLNGGGDFINLGEMKRTAGVGDTTFEVRVQTTGTIRIGSYTVAFLHGIRQTAGLVDMNGGTIKLKHDLLNPVKYELVGGWLAARGRIEDGGVLEHVGGTLELKGQLALTGNYEQSPTATIQVNGMSDTDWGYFDITGAASLTGNLNVWLVPGYLPTGWFGTILEASTGVIGEFQLVSPGWTDVYGGNEVYLVQDPSLPPPPPPPPPP